jgi:hypothetical protein
VRVAGQLHGPEVGGELPRAKDRELQQVSAGGRGQQEEEGPVGEACRGEEPQNSRKEDAPGTG